MAEEFQESDIIFSDNNNENSNSYYNNNNYKKETIQQLHRNNKIKKINKTKNMSCSLPINIPGHSFQQHLTDDDDDEEIVPPYVIVAKRVAGRMPFSVCTGNGRTLKGRDLSHVRNSVLRMTGFLET